MTGCASPVSHQIVKYIISVSLLPFRCDAVSDGSAKFKRIFLDFLRHNDETGHESTSPGQQALHRGQFHALGTGGRRTHLCFIRVSVLHFAAALVNAHADGRTHVRSASLNPARRPPSMASVAFYLSHISITPSRVPQISSVLVVTVHVNASGVDGVRRRFGFHASHLDAALPPQGRRMFRVMPFPGFVLSSSAFF